MLILFVVLILAMIAFGIGLKILENHMPEPVISEGDFLADEQSEELSETEWEYLFLLSRF